MQVRITWLSILKQLDGMVNAYRHRFKTWMMSRVNCFSWCSTSSKPQEHRTFAYAKQSQSLMKNSVRMRKRIRIETCKNPATAQTYRHPAKLGAGASHPPQSWTRVFGLGLYRGVKALGSRALCAFAARWLVEGKGYGQ